MSDSVMMPTSDVVAHHRQRADLVVAHLPRRSFQRRVGRGDARLARHEIPGGDRTRLAARSMAARLSAALTANGLMSAGNACSTSECVTMPSSVPRSGGALTTGKRRILRLRT